MNVTKTNPREVAVPYGSNTRTCPVRAWKAWREAQAAAFGVNKIDPGGLAICGVDRHSRIGCAL